MSELKHWENVVRICAAQQKITLSGRQITKIARGVRRLDGFPSSTLVGFDAVVKFTGVAAKYIEREFSEMTA